jgi:hypothetical protein
MRPSGSPSIVGERLGGDNALVDNPRESWNEACLGDTSAGTLEPRVGVNSSASRWGHWDGHNLRGQSRAVPGSHSEWSVVIGSRLMARSAGI